MASIANANGQSIDTESSKVNHYIKVINDVALTIPKILNNVNIRDKSLKIVQFVLRFIISTFKLSINEEMCKVLQDSVNMCSNSRKFFRLFRYINCYANIINLLYILNYQINQNVQLTNERTQIQLNGVSQIPIEYLSNSVVEKSRTILKIGEQICWSLFFWYDSFILWARLSSQDSSVIERNFYRCWMAADIFHLFDHLLLFLTTLSHDVKNIIDLRESRSLNSNTTLNIATNTSSVYNHMINNFIQTVYDIYSLQRDYSISTTQRGKITSEVLKSVINLFVSSSFNPTINSFYKNNLSNSSLIVKDLAVTVFALISSVNSIKDSL